MYKADVWDSKAYCDLSFSFNAFSDPKNVSSSQGGEKLQNGFFSSVEKKDEGIYTCTRSYLYRGETYNMTFTMVLDVQTKGKYFFKMFIFIVYHL